MPMQAHKGGRGTAPTHLQSQCKKGVGGQHHAPASLIWGETLCPLCRRLGGPWGQSGEIKNFLSPLGFNPRTIQPEARHYTDYAIYIRMFLSLRYIYIAQHTYT